jgi:hypothetical protein
VKGGIQLFAVHHPGKVEQHETYPDVGIACDRERGVEVVKKTVGETDDVSVTIPLDAAAAIVKTNQRATCTPMVAIASKSARTSASCIETPAWLAQMLRPKSHP